MEYRQVFHIHSKMSSFLQRSPEAGNKCLLEHTSRNFRIPKEFGSWIYITQVLQALSIKTAVEHFRRLKPYCMVLLVYLFLLIYKGKLVLVFVLFIKFTFVGN